MAKRDTEMPVRKSRGSRRRPDVAAPKAKRIPPRSGLSRAEVIADQRHRILEGLALALAYHGYEDTKITDIVELAGVSRPTFYEHFESKESCFAAAYDDGVERLSSAVADAVRDERGWAPRLSAGLTAGLDFLAASPALAHLLLVESLAAARPARLEHELSLDRLAQTICPPPAGFGGDQVVSAQTARLLAGGLTSHLSGRVLAGEAERLPESHDLLLQYLLSPSLPAASRDAGERLAARG
jgi:AcrR family transcriptional regulator